MVVWLLITLTAVYMEDGAEGLLQIHLLKYFGCQTWWCNNGLFLGIDLIPIIVLFPQFQEECEIRF